jgi:predicted porin
MKKLGISLLATMGLVGLAHAADLPTTKAPPPAPPPPNCFGSLWDYLNTTATDCPLSYAGFTLYATLDAGVGYNTNGAGFNPAFPTGTSELIQKQNLGPKWQWTPNGISQSVVGIKMSEPLWNSGWSIVGTAETGFDPYSGYLANGQRSQVENNGKAIQLQNTNGDSGRSGEWDNSQGFIGVSNKEFGTVVFGRVNTLGLDGLIAYDSMGAAYAFSPFGWTGSYAGFGDTELSRSNTAFKYRVDFMNFRAAGLAQVGGYDQGNPTTGFWQGQLGGDFQIGPGTLSLDAIGSYAQDAVNTSTINGACSTLTSGPFKGQFACSYAIPTFYNSSDLKATLSNNTSLFLLAKYKWQQWTFDAGWIWWKQADPSDTFPDGFKTIGGYSVPGTIPALSPAIAKLFPTAWISYTTYLDPRYANTFFAGVKYAVTPWLDVAGAFYYLQQNNYSTTPCTGQGIHISSGSCAGSQDAISFMIDYRPVKRIDLYGGVMISNVYAGLANGYQAVQNIAPTAGFRIKF